jgi:4-amino-4-deoxy-L-arabinose transferase-like glycosyltransferase
LVRSQSPESGRRAQDHAETKAVPPELAARSSWKHISKAAKRTGPGWFPLLVMAMVASIGGALVVFTTEWGAGVTRDSTIYINAARNLLMGYGLSHPPGTPLTHYPPLYPLVLSLSGLLGKDPLDGARWVQAFLLFATLWCSVMMIFRATSGSLLAWLTGFLLLLTSQTVIYVYSFAWSESLFILLSVSGFLMLGEYLKEPKPLLFMASSMVIGLAFLTRYVGVSLVITGCCFILLFSRLNTIKRWTATVIFGAISIFPMCLWLLRNRVVGGTLTNRTLVRHPPTLEDINAAVLTMSMWLGIPQDWPLSLKTSLLALSALAILTSYVILVWSYKRKRAVQESPIPLYLPSLFIILAVCYLLFLGISISFVDAHTPLDMRVLSPLFVFGAIGMVCLGYHLWVQFGKKQAVAIPILMISFLFIGNQVVSSVPLVASFHNEGIGFASKYWKHSQIMELVKSVPEDITIYTNGPDAIDILAGKSALMIPAKVEAGTRLANEDFAAQFADMANQIRAGKSIVVYFSLITWRWYLPTKEEVARNIRHRVLYDGWDGTVFGTD